MVLWIQSGISLGGTFQRSLIPATNSPFLSDSTAEHRFLWLTDYLIQSPALKEIRMSAAVKLKSQRLTSWIGPYNNHINPSGKLGVLYLRDGQKSQGSVYVAEKVEHLFSVYVI